MKIVPTDPQEDPQQTTEAELAGAQLREQLSKELTSDPIRFEDPESLEAVLNMAGAVGVLLAILGKNEVIDAQVITVSSDQPITLATIDSLTKKYFDPLKTKITTLTGVRAMIRDRYGADVAIAVLDEVISRGQKVLEFWPQIEKAIQPKLGTQDN